VSTIYLIKKEREQGGKGKERVCLTPEQVDRIMELVEFGGYVPKSRREGFRSDLTNLLNSEE